MTLDVRSAQIVLECARRGSLGAAATALNMTQPAITRMLKRLEDSYGVPLFERTTRGVVPTVFGDALLPYAKLVVSEIGNATDVIQQMRGASRGVVRIGGVASVVGGFIIAVIGEMRKQHSEVQYQVIEDLEDRVLEGLKGGTIDIAISPEPYLDDDIIMATPDIMHDTVSVFARSDHPIIRREHVIPRGGGKASTGPCLHRAHRPSGSGSGGSMTMRWSRTRRRSSPAPCRF
jgi:DNA-binding transcriptional LysR family regulator